MCTSEVLQKFVPPRVAPHEGSCQEVHLRGAHRSDIYAHARGYLYLIFRFSPKSSTDDQEVKIMSEGWESGSTRRWRRVRAAVLRRDGYRCQLRLPRVCLVDAPLKGGHVHHVHGKTRCAGCRADQPTHLQAACAPCNLKTGEPTMKGDPPCNPMTDWSEWR